MPWGCAEALALWISPCSNKKSSARQIVKGLADYCNGFIRYEQVVRLNDTVTFPNMSSSTLRRIGVNWIPRALHDL